jgi:two-component system cell cycle sensor histidine kinase/response regulator CckA
MNDHWQRRVPYASDVRLRGRQGTYRWYRTRGQAVWDEQGRAKRMLGFMRDITDQRIFEQKVRNSYKLEAIGRLAGGIAHDFNNILFAMLGYAELVKQDMQPETESFDHINLVLKAGQRAKELVQHILAFSRQQEIEREPARLDQILREALRFLRASLPSSIKLVEQIDEQDVTVQADPVQMYQLIINLCTNASHAIGDQPGEILVVLRPAEVDIELATRHAGLQPGPHVLISVRDNGCGMSPDVVERMFDPFFTTKEPGRGTGMGLALVHGIVTAHHGAIDLSSEQGSGTSFDIYLPRSISEALEAPLRSETGTRGQGRILLVDDEPDVADIVTKMLTRLGYSVTAFTDSMEALDAFKTKPEGFDLVITDQTMPRVTGSQLASQIATLRPGLPIIMCTGFHANSPENEAAGVISEVLMKPLISAELSDAVQRVLDAKPAATPKYAP